MLPKSASSDQTIGENECMVLSVAACWFNLRGCKTTADILAYHARKGHFHTFTLNHKLRVSYREAERVLGLNPVWLHSSHNNGLPAGYVSVSRAVKLHGVELSLLIHWIEKGGIRYQKLSTKGSASYAVYSPDVVEAAMKAERIRQRTLFLQAKQREDLEMRVSDANTGADKVKTSAYCAAQGLKNSRLINLIKQNLIEAEVTGEGPGTQYFVSKTEMDKLLESIPELKEHLKPKGPKVQRVRKILIALRDQGEPKTETPREESQPLSPGALEEAPAAVLGVESISTKIGPRLSELYLAYARGKFLDRHLRQAAERGIDPLVAMLEFAQQEANAG